MATKTYDPGKYFISFANIPLTGFADNTFLKVSQASETFSSVVGTGGEVTRVRNRDARGKMTVSLLGSSRDNDKLMAIHLADKLLGSGIGIFNVVDGNGTTFVLAANAWITKAPDLERGKDAPMHDWEFECEELDEFVGGMTV